MTHEHDSRESQVFLLRETYMVEAGYIPNILVPSLLLAAAVSHT